MSKKPLPRGFILYEPDLEGCMVCGKDVDMKKPRERAWRHTPDGKRWVLCMKCYVEKVQPRELDAWRDAIRDAIDGKSNESTEEEEG